VTHIRRLRTGKTIAGLVITALVIIGLWYWNVSVSDTALLVECRQYYAQAHTQADTLRIDGVFLDRSGRGPAALTCGALRRAAPK